MSAIKMAAKYPGKCSACGGSVQAGESILWAKGQGAKHVTCGAASATTTYSARIESSRRAWGARRSMGSGHGSAPNVPGYSSYCTDNASCRCYDCAS